MTTPQISTSRKIWNAWIRFGFWLGNIMSWVWMPLFYYVFATPFALAVKIFVDPLRLHGKTKSSYWVSKKMPTLDLTWAKSQGSVVLPKKNSSN